MQDIRFQTPKGERRIGKGFPTFIIAEISGNHQQEKEKAFRLIDAAAEAGVDAVKLQTYTPDTLTIDCENEYFQVRVNDAWKGQTLYRLYQSAFTPWEWQAEMKAYGEQKGLTVFSTPFDETAVDFLETLEVPLYKVASFESGDLELLKRIGSTGKPVIMSRGLTPLDDVRAALDVLRDAGVSGVAVLHCVSSYPAEPSQMNLATIPDLERQLGAVVGLSDHTLGTTTAVAAVALGASIVEKHFTLRRSDGGPDAAFSLEPEEMKGLVRAIRETEAAIGVPTYSAGPKEAENLVFRRSLFVVSDIAEGEAFSRENVRCIRPGYGLPPKELPDVLGKRARRNIERGTPLSWELII
ncbi:MAG: pseudaminic acid synthase [Patescibacteria group bacterium]